MQVRCRLVYQHCYGLLLFVMAIILLLDMVGAFIDISRWIHGVFVVIISGFGIFDSIGLLGACFWAKEMMILVVSFSSNECFIHKKLN